MGSDPGKVSEPTEPAGTTGVTEAKEAKVAAKDKKTTRAIAKIREHVLESPDVDVFSIKAFERYAIFKTIGKK